MKSFLLASLALAAFSCGTEEKKTVVVDKPTTVSWPNRTPSLPGTGERSSGGTLTPGPGHKPRDSIKHPCEIKAEPWCFPRHPEPQPFPEPEPQPQPEPEPEPQPEPEPGLPEDLDIDDFFWIGSKKWIYCDLIPDRFKEYHNSWWDFIPEQRDWCNRIGNFTISGRGCRCRKR
jgi:hypothetical protein